MGNIGSTRWGFHQKKTLVENSLKMCINSLHPYLCPGIKAGFAWKRDNKTLKRIKFFVEGDKIPTGIRLSYRIGSYLTSQSIYYDYSVRLVTTQTPWGSFRYWFICPLINNGKSCHRRVGCLYLPPGERYFGCRTCHNLTYRSSQKQHILTRHWKFLAARLQGYYPGITWQEVRSINKGDLSLVHHYRDRKSIQDTSQLYGNLEYRDLYSNYLSTKELCAKSGLSIDDLARLESARILVPDRNSKYRPKLVSWANKLAYLLAEGWSLDEIKQWSKGRWSTPNPRQWPPDHAEWKLVITTDIYLKII